MNAVTRAAIKADAAIAFMDGKAEMPLPRLLVSQAESARMLGVSRVSVYRLVQSGELQPVMIRGARRYRVADLRKLAEGCK